MTAPPTLYWDDAPRPRRRRAWPWLVSLLVAIGLLGGAALAGEWLARDLVERGVRGQLASELGVPADRAEVEVEGIVLAQLISGRFSEVRVSVENVSLGAFAGDVDVTARGVPITADGALDSGEATVAIDQAQLRALLSSVEGFPAQTLGLTENEVTITVDLNVFGVSIPVGVGLTPSAADRALALTPATLRVADTSVDAQGLRDRFGAIADVALQTWQVCVASSLPAGLTLADVVVADERVIARFDIAPDILVDGSLREPGSCG